MKKYNIMKNTFDRKKYVTLKGIYIYIIQICFHVFVRPHNIDTN